jgi:AcrR family transcriptional regulator
MGDATMARASAKSRKAASAKAKAAGSSGTPIDRIVDAALDEAAETGWRELTLAGVADRAGMDLGALLLLAPTKFRLLSAFLDRIDRATLGGVKSPDARDKVRDRLFEIIMRRFDALNAHREGAKAMISGLLYDPLMAVCIGMRFRRSVAAMLAGAGVRADGLIGRLRVKGLAAVSLAGLRAWMRDDTEDMAKTMAAVDRALAQAERLSRLLPGAHRHGEDATETT